MSETKLNPYQAYYNAMLDVQKDLVNQYFEAVQRGEWDASMPPPFPMGPGAFPPNMLAPFGAQPFSQPGSAPNASAGNPMYSNLNDSTQIQDENNPLFKQAQAMLDSALGDEADSFKEILGSFGMSDKEFWKGAMIGAAAALLLSNDKVRGKLMDVFSGATDALKTGSDAVKNSAVNTAASVKENVTAGGEIFKETYAAGKQGFHESVEKQKSKPASTEETEHVIKNEPDAPLPQE